MKNGVKIIQTAGYNGARTVFIVVFFLFDRGHILDFYQKNFNGDSHLSMLCFVFFMSMSMRYSFE